MHGGMAGFPCCRCRTLHPDHSSAMITGKRQAWLQGKPWISGPWSLGPALAPGPCLGPWPFGPCPDPWPLALALAPARGPWPVAPSPGLGPCPGSLALGPCPDTCPGPKGPGNLALASGPCLGHCPGLVPRLWLSSPGPRADGSSKTSIHAHIPKTGSRGCLLASIWGCPLGWTSNQARRMPVRPLLGNVRMYGGF